MSNHVPGFQSFVRFFASFYFGKISHQQKVMIIQIPNSKGSFNPKMCWWWLIWPIKMMQKTLKMTETLAHEYSSESTQRELSNEYPYDRV